MERFRLLTTMATEAARCTKIKMFTAAALFLVKESADDSLQYVVAATAVGNKTLVGQGSFSNRCAKKVHVGTSGNFQHG